MIEMRYFDRAQALLDQFPEESAMREIFRGDLALAGGNTEGAAACWNTVSSDDQAGQYQIGKRFSWIGNYTEAIAHYKSSFAAAVFPRDLSAVYSLAFLYTKLGQNEDAANAWQTILDVLASDYGITEGETVNWPRREIEKLKNC